MEGGIWRVRDNVIVLGEDNHVLFGLYEWDNEGIIFVIMYLFRIAYLCD